jgi:hypothetical protein
LLNQFVTVVSCIIEHNTDRYIGMSLANQLKKLDYCVGVNVGGASHGKNFSSVAAYSAKHLVSLSSTCASNVSVRPSRDDAVRC